MRFTAALHGHWQSLPGILRYSFITYWSYLIAARKVQKCLKQAQKSSALFDTSSWVKDLETTIRLLLDSSQIRTIPKVEPPLRHIIPATVARWVNPVESLGQWLANLALLAALAWCAAYIRVSAGYPFFFEKLEISPESQRPSLFHRLIAWANG